MGCQELSPNLQEHCVLNFTEPSLQPQRAPLHSGRLSLINTPRTELKQRLRLINTDICSQRLRIPEQILLKWVTESSIPHNLLRVEYDMTISDFRGGVAVVKRNNFYSTHSWQTVLTLAFLDRGFWIPIQWDNPFSRQIPTNSNNHWCFFFHSFDTTDWQWQVHLWLVPVIWTLMSSGFPYLTSQKHGPHMVAWELCR